MNDENQKPPDRKDKNLSDDWRREQGREEHSKKVARPEPAPKPGQPRDQGTSSTGPGEDPKD